MEWKHKIAVITGASTGIGKATKELLRSKGAIVYNLDRNKPGEEDTHFIFCDVSKKDNVGTAIDQVFEKEKRIDMLFANAGFIYLQHWKKQLMNNLNPLLGSTYWAFFTCLKKQYRS